MDIKLPHLGEGADSGTVVNLLVKEGDTIEQNQPILELENEKAVATIPATAAGKISRIHVKVGDKVSAGQRLLSVGAAGETPPAPAPKPATAKAPVPASEPEPAPAEATTEAPDEPAASETPVNNDSAAAAPSIRKLANELGIDLGKVRGSERGGRIVMADVRAYIQKLLRTSATPKTSSVATAPAAAPAESIDFAKWGPILKKPLTPLRKVIGRRMLENWNAIPHVTQFDEADLTAILALRKQYVAAYEKAGARLTVTSFVLRALVATLKKHPGFNSSLDEAAGELILKEYYHIGIAVNTEAGLIVPVLRDADQKNLVEISRELEELARKARDRKVSAEELKGGTFTVSNQGGIGGAHFTPIVNKPEVAILGLGKGALKPVVRGGQIEARTMLPLAISYDHRVIDGGAAARFAVDLVGALENFNEADVRL